MASGFGSRRKRGPDVKSDKADKITQQHHGRLGFLGYLQAYQLILRHQSKFIARTLSIPDYEPLLQKLWHLLLEAQHAEDSLPEDEDMIDNDNMSDTAIEQDTEMNLESDSAADTVITQREEYESAYYAMHRPLLIHTIALAYLTLNILRVPITVHHFNSWIDTGDFAYISAINLIPADLRRKLESQYHAALDPQLRPRASRIWKWTQQTAIFLKLNSDIVFAEANYRPMLYNIVKDTLMPLDVYNAVDRQVTRLKINMNLVAEERNPIMSIPPEARILCLALIIAKLFYNLDGVKRKTESLDSAPARGPNLGAWHRAIKLLVSTLQGVDLASKTEPKDVFSMNEASLDDYLDWYARNWTVKTSHLTNKYLAIPEGILNMFPLREVATPDIPSITPTQNRLETVQWLYSIPRDWTPESRLRPGEQYHSTTLDGEDKESLWDDLIELAALLHQLSTTELRKQIIHLERKIASQHFDETEAEKKRKKQVGRPRKYAKRKRAADSRNIQEEPASRNNDDKTGAEERF